LFVPDVDTLAVSREATLFVNFRLPDVTLALRLAAGLQSAAASEKQMLDIVSTGASSNVVDILDAAAIGLRVAHPELVP
jgi:hypothetical protein